MKKMMKKWIPAIVIASLFIGIYFFKQLTSPQYPVQVISSFVDAKPYLAQCDKNSLVLFDVDDTLIRQLDTFARGNTPWLLHLQACIAFPALLHPSQWERIISLVDQMATYILIEPQVVTIINTLKQKRCLVLALTSIESKNYGVIPDRSLWRATMLKNMHITFSKNFPNQTYTQFEPYRTSYPVLYEGILCTNLVSKGKVLEAFLQANKLKPTHVLFFDDDLRNLQSVGKACENHAIPCTLFHYCSPENFSATLSNSLILKQIDFLIKENRWISDQEIVKMPS